MADRVLEQRRNFDARRSLARFWRDQRGVTAIEFAFLALPFFGLLAAIMQTALVFLSGQILDAAVYQSARLIQTGQAKSFTHDQYKTIVCDGLYKLFDCDNVKLKVAVVGIAPPAVTSPLNGAGEWTADWTAPTDYAPGGAGSVVRVQVYYKWPVPVNAAGFFGVTGSSPDNTQLLGASYVFMNEPF